MFRETLLLLALLQALLFVHDLSAKQQDFDVYELSIPELQAAMERGETTSEELVQGYLKRIEAFDRHGPKLNAMIHINPNATRIARALDLERASKGSRGPLHGIPMVLKDNFDTFDMPTTASAVALAGFTPPDDGYQVRKLREAGVVFIGKTNMHEFARGIETISSSGGQTLNPYDPRRNPGGSSGGTATAVAASFAATGMGSDTCGSIRIPAANNNLFGLRVTQGLSSRDGIIPLSHTQDVGGPLARSMIDLVTVLDATVGPDSADPQTAEAASHIPGSYSEFLSTKALHGARLGLLSWHLKTSSPFGEVSGVIHRAAEVMAGNGAEVIEVNIKDLDSMLRVTSVIDQEFGFDLEDYLEQSGAPVSTLEEILQSGQFHAALEKRYRRSLGLEENSAKYRERLANRQVVKQILLGAMAEHELDALVYPTIRVKPVFVGESQYGSLCRIAAHSGLPAITLPAGFTADGLPVGVELLARPFEEGQLIAFGFAYEQAIKPRRPPARTPSLVNDVLSYPFELDSPRARGRLLFDRPTQTLNYELRFSGLKDRDILDIKIHRGAAGEKGPVIELLGKARKNSVPIRNEDIDKLLAGHLYLVVYTNDEPQGAIRGQISRIGN